MDFRMLLHNPWIQRLIALSLGGMSALAFAPLFILPAYILAFSAIWVMFQAQVQQRATLSHLFWLGWWFGLGHFAAGLYWIAHALTVDLDAFWWLMPFALFGIPAILAVFIGIVFSLASLWPYDGISRAFAFTALWGGAEWLRGHIFTGFPWNLSGYVWGFSLEEMQLASVVGVYGLSMLVVLMSICLGYIVGHNKMSRNIGLLVFAIAVFGWGWGKYRLENANVKEIEPLAIRLVQPNIKQTMKWDPQQREDNFITLLDLSMAPSSLPLNAVLWPETAVPFFLEQETFRRIQIADSLPKEALLFTGALRRSDSNEGKMQAWNSLLVLDDQGEIVASYDKAHLVPFGEYLPFRSTLDTLLGKGTIKKITTGTIDFTPGAGPELISLPQGFPSFSGLVCYEVIFPRAIVNPDQPRPDWLINVTNDAWYGNTSGPYQHLEITRFRAIEEGIPLVRVANSGISAVINAYGRNMGSLGLGKKGVLDIFLPAPTQAIPFYGHWGDRVTFVLILMLFGLGWVVSLQRKREVRAYPTN